MRSFSLILLFLSLVVVALEAVAQCGTADFNLVSEACRHQKILVRPDDVHETVEWDFCSGDFNSAPTAAPAFQITGAVGRPSLELIEDDGTWFGFVTGTWTNSLQVLEFGNGLEQAPTDIFAAGNLNSYLNGPGSIQIIREDDTWYGIIHNSGSAEILRVTFGNQFSEVRDVTVLTSSVGYINSGLAMGKDPLHGWIGLISESDNTFTIIRYGNNLHPSLPEDIISTPSVPNPNNLGDIDLINICGQWFAAAVNLAGGNTYLLTFGDDLFSLPQISQIATLSIANGARLRFAQEGAEFFLFVASLDGFWHTLKFGETMHESPIVENQTDLNGTLAPETYALALVKENSAWTIFNVAQNNGQVYRIKYPEACSAIPVSSQESAAIVQFAEAGTYSVSMQIVSNGESTTKSKSINVSPESAPDIDFHTENVCAGYDVFFTPLNISADIEVYEWSFGDLATSVEAITAHQYANEDKYDVTLSVTGANGCHNTAFKSVVIYPAPLANFSEESASLLCTNNPVTFINNTEDFYDGQLFYQWLVDGDPVSSERDLTYTFSTTGVKAIKLVTTIPGCANEITKTTSSFAAGPVVDFTYTGTCEDEMFSFQQRVSDPVESYLWDFGGTGTSPDPDPTRTFTEYGDYQVSLTATNNAGCHNVRTKTVAVHSRPLVDFSAPNSCSGANTVFTNQTMNPDSRAITEWLWDFDGITQPEWEGHHIFSAAGTFNVTLTATTAAGCNGTMEKPVTILPSPSTDFTFTPACDDMPVQFTGSGDEDIASWYWEIGTSYYDTPSPTHTFKSAGDHLLYLEVTALNSCLSTATHTIHVPEPVVPDFTAIRNCVGQEAVLTDITGGEDPVASRQWSLNGVDVSSASSFVHTFLEEGNENVALSVTTAAGCSYALSRTVSILPPPIAEFSANPILGAYPLDVSFANTSTSATAYLWEFGSGATSTESSPEVTFQERGTFPVKLTAYNNQQCQDSFETVITTLDPRPDADIEMINLLPKEDGSLKLIVTIHNKGNTILKALPIELDFSGSLGLRDITSEPILPAAQYNHVVNTEILRPETLRYLCVAIHVANDVTPSGNRMCEEFDNELFVFPAYPNPVAGSLNLEWISAADKTVRISLINTLGKTISTSELAAPAGLNRQIIDVSGLENGLYVLLIDDGTIRNAQHIVVSNRL